MLATIASALIIFGFQVIYKPLYLIRMMKMNRKDVSCILAAIFITLINNISCICSVNCTQNTLNAYCAFQDYCSCKNGYVFNCSVPASFATQSSSLSLISNISYFIMSSQINKQLEYTFTLSDPNNADILTAYNPDILTDEGMFIDPAITYQLTSVQDKPYQFSCKFTIQLGNQPGTQDPQRLVLKINSNGINSSSLHLSYSYSVVQTSNIFLILGYVAGGLLVVVSIFLIIVVYRKKQRITRTNQAQQQKIDILFFDEVMPVGMISIQAKKQTQCCSVCLQQFDFNSSIRTTVCDHTFHSACLDQWCVKNLSCPMCRTCLSYMNILRLKLEKANKTDGEWIINSLAVDEFDEEEVQSEIKTPFQLQNSEIYNNRSL